MQAVASTSASTIAQLRKGEDVKPRLAVLLVARRAAFGRARLHRRLRRADNIRPRNMHVLAGKACERPVGAGIGTEEHRRVLPSRVEEMRAERRGRFEQRLQPSLDGRRAQKQRLQIMLRKRAKRAQRRRLLIGPALLDRAVHRVRLGGGTLLGLVFLVERLCLRAVQLAKDIERLHADEPRALNC